MRKLLPFSLIIAAIAAISLDAVAKPVTAIQAIQRVTGNSTNRPKSMKAITTSPQLVHTFTASPTETEPMVYVFNRGTDQGYLITPADDLFPAVLGYSDKGDFDFDNMPPAMKAFLEDYAREINFNLKYKAEELATTASLFDPGWDPVEPLMATKWNQDAPYNNQCPTVSGVRTYTGCVATSMAQVMKYHEWPDVGVGSHSYTWNSQTLSIDFSTIQFDWNNMLNDYYNNSYTTTQANAVAQLMKAVGYSVDMGYGTNASGASTRNQTIALVKFFKYSKSVRYLDRDVVSSTEFEKIIYDNLAEGLPVLYDGGSSSGAHSFVCDGYAGKHYFHFNWGWGGSSDGYFYLCRLNPHDQGIGSSNGGYNSGQGINYNIRPVRDGVDTGEPETYTANIVCDGDFNRKSNSGNSCVFRALDPATADAENEEDKVEEAFWNWTNYEFVGSLGVIVRDSENNETYFSGLNTNRLPAGNGYRYISPYITGLSQGDYTVHPAFKDNSADEPQLMKVSNGCKGFVKMKVSASGSLSFPTMTPGDFVTEVPDMMVNCFNYNGEVLSGQGHNFLISVTNLSTKTDYYGKLTMVIRDDSGSDVLRQSIGSYDVPAAHTIPESLNLTLNLEPGFYTVALEDASERELPGEFPLEITGYGEELTTDLQVTSFTPTDIAPNSTSSITFRVTNTGNSSITAGKFGIKCYNHDTFSLLRSWTVDYGNFNLSSQGSINLTVTGVPFNLSEGTYDIEITQYLTGNNYQTISQNIILNVGYPVESVAINEQDNKLEKDEEMQLTATLTPANATYRTLSWTSSNSNIVSVDNDGNIKALSPGTAYISATAHNGSIDHTQVVVKGNSSISDISADELKTVNAVYTISGVKILANPTEAQIHDLDPGLYIFQTPKRAFTVKK